MGRMYIATETFNTNLLSGQPIWVHRGVDVVDESDELRQRFPQYFREDERYTPDVEDASAAPGVKRGARERAGGVPPVEDAEGGQ